MARPWRQGPLSRAAVSQFLVIGPRPGRLLFAEPPRRRMRVKFGGAWIAGGEDAADSITVGPLRAIHVPPRGQPGLVGLLRDVAARMARHVAG